MRMQSSAEKVLAMDVSKQDYDNISCDGTHNILVKRTVKEYAISEEKIRIIRKACNNNSKLFESINELSLSIFSLTIGAILSMLLQGTAYEGTLIGVITYTVLPIISAVSIITYISCRFYKNNSHKQISDVVMENLPNIDDPENEHEYR